MRTKTTLAVLCAAFALSGVTMSGCNAKRVTTSAERAEIQRDVAVALDDFREADPGIQSWLRSSYGYAVFPSVGKGAVGVGGAYGQGMVYENGLPIGTTALTQASIGFQLGGQAYRELIFFEDKAALEKFTSGRFEFAANASAVAVEAGASAAASFYDGMAIFTITKGGLMFEASIGGQKFSYRELGYE